MWYIGNCETENWNIPLITFNNTDLAEKWKSKMSYSEIQVDHIYLEIRSICHQH